MKPTRPISFLRGIITLDHHCQNCVAPSGRNNQYLTSLADFSSSRSPFPSATASHSWESVQVSGPSGLWADGGGGRRGEAPGGRRGSKLYVRTSGTPISVCECSTDGPLFLLKLSFHYNPPHPTPLSPQPHPTPPPATGGCRGRAQWRAGRWWGAPSDFKDIDRHFSIVQKPRNSSDGPPPPSPQTATNPLSPCSTSAQVDYPPRASPRNARSERIAMWQPHSCRLWHWPLRVVFTVGSVKSAAWLRGRTAHNGSLSSNKTYSGKVGSDILLKKTKKNPTVFSISISICFILCIFEQHNTGNVSLRVKQNKWDAVFLYLEGSVFFIQIGCLYQCFSHEHHFDQTTNSCHTFLTIYFSRDLEFFCRMIIHL